MASAVRILEPTTEPLTTEAIIDRIQAYVDRGDYPLLAAEKVTRELCREGRQDELLTLFYPPPLFEIWQSTKPATASPRAVRQRDRRAALRSAASLLESVVQVGGAWKRLGSLTRSDCLQAAAHHKRAALATAKKARWLHAIAQKLTDTQTVRDALDDEQLAQMLDEAGR